MILLLINIVLLNKYTHCLMNDSYYAPQAIRTEPGAGHYAFSLSVSIISVSDSLSHSNGRAHWP